MKKNIVPIQTILISKNMIEQRIDNFLIKKIKKIPKSFIYKIIRKGKVKINEKKILPKYKLKIGDVIKIPSMKMEKKNENSISIEKMREIFNLKGKILYEDNFLLIINKPSGIAVHGGTGLRFGIIENLRLLYPNYSYLELVHRIDKLTSGVLMIAKKRSTLRNLHKQIREKKIKKQYLALVHGHWKKYKSIISVPLQKKKNKNVKNPVFVHKQGKISETKFQVKKYYKNCTLMIITPKTGRTHQIRVHSAHAGHPIIFDECYGKPELDKNFLFLNEKKSLFLHAKKVCFLHPNIKKKLFISAPIEKRFQSSLLKLI
ncbi:RluA family pseudouridine synthase [Buchnera aphidicola (Mindarus keteleerifoliae)]|uniref:RluA family pseudouridine synthase n=1 Tax=Buchnera aphidicola TaxID=9 RepID=UPI0031B70C84